MYVYMHACASHMYTCRVSLATLVRQTSQICATFKFKVTLCSCDLLSSGGGGGWTVLQRRKDGSADLKNRDWVEYEDGFGNLHGEFWIGLRSMHCLTSQGHWEL